MPVQPNKVFALQLIFENFSKMCMNPGENIIDRFWLWCHPYLNLAFQEIERLEKFDEKTKEREPRKEYLFTTESILFSEIFFSKIQKIKMKGHQCNNFWLLTNPSQFFQHHSVFCIIFDPVLTNCINNKHKFRLIHK